MKKKIIKGQYFIFILDLESQFPNSVPSALFKATLNWLNGIVSIFDAYEGFLYGTNSIFQL